MGHWFARFVLSAFALLFIACGGGATEQTGPEKPTTARDFETQVQRELVPGLSRSAAENLLHDWNVNYRFVPTDQFPENNLTTMITTPPPNTAGALVGATKAFEKTGLFERFVEVVIFIDASGKVSKVGSKALTIGP